MTSPFNTNGSGEKSIHGSPKVLTRRVLAAYAAPAFSQALIHGPTTGSIIQGIYASQFGLSMQSVASVLLAAGIFDAVSNPLIGYWSDRSRARFGSRKAWLIAGSLIGVLACWFLYVPAPPVTTAYLMFWLLFAYFGWAVSEIPYGAWMAEISMEYDQRTRLAAWRTACTYLGAMAFFAIPLLPFFPSTEFTAATLRSTAILAAIALPSLTAIAAAFVPNGAARTRRSERRPFGAWHAILHNRPLLAFALMFTLVGLASGISTGLLYFYVTGYLHQGHALAQSFLVTLPVGALSVPTWGYLCRRFGKQRAWAVGTLGGALAILLYALVPPGPGAALWFGIILALVIGLFVSYSVAAPAVLADVVDYGRLRFGADFAGTYFGFYIVMYKAVPNIGAAAGIALAAFLGFNPHLAEQTPNGGTGLLLTFCAAPALLLIIAAVLIWRFPIDSRRQRIIARRLQGI